MGLLAPWFLGGLAVLSVPVFVHLLRRHVTTPRPVSSLMFFERGVQSSTRHRRLKYLVLFVLRSTLLLLVVLAFANPFVRRVSANTQQGVMMIVLDHSFSMRSGTHFADAKREALAALAVKPQSQKAQVMALGAQMQVLTQPVTDGGQLRGALESIQPGDGHASFGELGRVMRTLADTVHSPVDLHLFSDMQRSAMPANFADMVMPGNVTVHLHSVAHVSAGPNWTIENVEAPDELSDPKDPERSKVQAVVVGYGTPVATKTVSLVVNGKTVATRSVNVASNGRAALEFSPLEIGYGFNHCEVRVEGEDALPADNADHFVVRRSDPARVLLVHAPGEIRSATYFGAALKAAAKTSFLVQSVSQEKTSDFDPSRFAFVVLSDSVELPAIFEHTLAQYVARGGGVLIALGTNASRHAHIPIWGGDIRETHDYVRTGITATVGNVDFSHPAVMDAKPGRENGGWDETKVFYSVGVDLKDARVAVRLSDGAPLLVDKPIGQGHVLLLTSGLENITNDLPLHPVFVAFVDHSAQYLSGGSRLSGSRLVDSYVRLRAPNPSGESANVEVIDPFGHRPLSLSDARTAQTFRLENVGFYQIRLANGKDSVIGVNADRRESDLQPMGDDVLKLWSGASSRDVPGANAGSMQDEIHRSVSIWWYVMLLALLTAFAEFIFASGYMGTQREDI
jgi:hypothetical protein